MSKNKFSNKKITYLIISIILLSNIILIFNNKIVKAYNENDAGILVELGKLAEDEAGYPEANESSLMPSVALIVASLLSLLGIMFLVLILMGGYQWMTAGGNEETITKAKKRSINATIGLAIIALAYAIHIFVIKTLLS